MEDFKPWGKTPKEVPGRNGVLLHEGNVEIAARDPHDPQPYIDRLNAVFVPEFDKLEGKAVGITVNSNDANDLAVEMMNQLDRFRIDLDKHRKKIVGDPTAFIRGINQFATSWTTKAMNIKAQVAAKVKAWMFDQEKKRKEAEKEALEEAERKRKEEAAKVPTKEEPFFDMPPPPPPPPPIIPRATKTEVATGTAAVKKVWKWTIVNFKDLPDECFKERADLIEKAIAPWINTRIKAGLKVPGVDSWQEDDLKTSTKRS